MLSGAARGASPRAAKKGDSQPISVRLVLKTRQFGGRKSVAVPFFRPRPLLPRTARPRLSSCLAGRPSCRSLISLGAFLELGGGRRSRGLGFCPLAAELPIQAVLRGGGLRRAAVAALRVHVPFRDSWFFYLFWRFPFLVRRSRFPARRFRFLARRFRFLVRRPRCLARRFRFLARRFRCVVPRFRVVPWRFPLLVGRFRVLVRKFCSVQLLQRRSRERTFRWTPLSSWPTRTTGRSASGNSAISAETSPPPQERNRPVAG